LSSIDKDSLQGDIVDEFTIETQAETVFPRAGEHQLAGMDTETHHGESVFNGQSWPREHGKDSVGGISELHSDVILSLGIRHLHEETQGSMDDWVLLGMNSVENSDNAPLAVILPEHHVRNQPGFELWRKGHKMILSFQGAK
jgi:hypothetical protein